MHFKIKTHLKSTGNKLSRQLRGGLSCLGKVGGGVFRRGVWSWEGREYLEKRGVWEGGLVGGLMVVRREAV